MKRDWGSWQTAGFAFVSVAGTVLHFLYDWTGNTVIALFSGVNESTWEHMKLLFFPMFLFAIVEKAVMGKDESRFWCVKLKGIVRGLVWIPVLFYTLRGVFGPTADFINIGIFFVSAGLSFAYETRQFNSHTTPCRYEKHAFMLIGVIAVMFVLFTFVTPPIPLFQDPIDGRFGI